MVAMCGSIPSIVPIGYLECGAKWECRLHLGCRHMWKEGPEQPHLGRLGSMCIVRDIYIKTRRKDIKSAWWCSWLSRSPHINNVKDRERSRVRASAESIVFCFCFYLLCSSSAGVSLKKMSKFIFLTTHLNDDRTEPYQHCIAHSLIPFTSEQLIHPFLLKRYF